MAIQPVSLVNCKVLEQSSLRPVFATHWASTEMLQSELGLNVPKHFHQHNFIAALSPSTEKSLQL